MNSRAGRRWPAACTIYMRLDTLNPPPTIREVVGVTVFPTVFGHIVRTVVELSWDMYGCEFKLYSFLSYRQQSGVINFF